MMLVGVRGKLWEGLLQPKSVGGYDTVHKAPGMADFVLVGPIIKVLAAATAVAIPKSYGEYIPVLVAVLVIGGPRFHSHPRSRSCSRTEGFWRV